MMHYFLCETGTGFYVGFMMLFWLMIIILIIYILFKILKSEDFSFKKSENSLEILKKRYAKGQINKKQFDVMKKELK